MWIFIIIIAMWFMGTIQMKSEESAEKARVAKMSPEELKSYKNDKCKWDKLGRYEYAIQQLLKDPDSYKRLSYEFYSNHALEINYTATNSFGGRVKEGRRIYFAPDWCGKQVKIEEF